MLACHNVGMAFDQDTTRQALRWDRIAVLMAVEPVELEGSEGSEGSVVEAEVLVLRGTCHHTWVLCMAPSQRWHIVCL